MQAPSERGVTNCLNGEDYTPLHRTLNITNAGILVERYVELGVLDGIRVLGRICQPNPTLLNLHMQRTTLPSDMIRSAND